MLSVTYSSVVEFVKRFVSEDQLTEAMGFLKLMVSTAIFVLTAVMVLSFILERFDQEDEFYARVLIVALFVGGLLYTFYRIGFGNLWLCVGAAAFYLVAIFSCAVARKEIDNIVTPFFISFFLMFFAHNLPVLQGITQGAFGLSLLLSLLIVAIVQCPGVKYYVRGFVALCALVGLARDYFTITDSVFCILIVIMIVAVSVIKKISPEDA